MNFKELENLLIDKIKYRTEILKARKMLVAKNNLKRSCLNLLTGKNYEDFAGK